jgi:two-component system, LytTR family, sensor kinase
MGKSPSRYYLYCQCIGWGSVLVLTLFLQFIFTSHHLTGKWTWRTALFTVLGLLYTHLLRQVLVKYRCLQLPVKLALPKLLLGIMLTAVIAGSTLTMAVSGLKFYPQIFDYILFITPWTIIYYGYHYVLKTRTQDLQRRRLGLLLKERQELAKDPAVDIDFITDSLNHIKSMIDQDPQASREEITAFSQLLRNGYLKQK